MRLLTDVAGLRVAKDLGSLPAPAPAAGPSQALTGLGETTAEHRLQLGDVPGMGPPAFPLLGTYPSTKSSSAAARPLSQGLALLMSNDTEGALVAFDRAEALLSKEAKVDLTPLFMLSTLADPEVADAKRLELYQGLSKDHQEQAIKLLNRRGLAYKDDEDLELARVAFEAVLVLDKRYAPALYNLACLTANEPLEQEPCAVLSRARRALTMLTVAVREDAPFIRKLASADPDLNDLREHPRYRRLMGLPPLPPGPPRPVGVLPHLPAPSSVARGQIEQAFLRDRAHDPQLAISELDKAIPALGAELTAALPALDPAEKAALADGSRIGVYKVLEKRGVWARYRRGEPACGRDRFAQRISALPPALQDTALMFFNRLGLAYFHDGDLYMAESYLKWALTLRPGYAPASYNLACLEAQQAKYLPPEQAAELEGHARAKIDTLIAKDPGFFGPLALIDGDLLGLGYTGAWTIKLSDEVKARSLR